MSAAAKSRSVNRVVFAQRVEAAGERKQEKAALGNSRHPGLNRQTVGAESVK